MGVYPPVARRRRAAGVGDWGGGGDEHGVPPAVRHPLRGRAAPIPRPPARCAGVWATAPDPRQRLIPAGLSQTLSFFMWWSGPTQNLCARNDQAAMIFPRLPVRLSPHPGDRRILLHPRPWTPCPGPRRLRPLTIDCSTPPLTPPPAGTLLVGAAQPFFRCSPALLSATWFGAQERTTATSTALNFNQVACLPPCFALLVMATVSHPEESANFGLSRHMNQLSDAFQVLPTPSVMLGFCLGRQCWKKSTHQNRWCFLGRALLSSNVFTSSNVLRAKFGCNFSKCHPLVDANCLYKHAPTLVYQSPSSTGDAACCRCLESENPTQLTVERATPDLSRSTADSSAVTVTPPNITELGYWDL